MKDSVTGSKSLGNRGLSGRGGAGNWTQGNGEEDKRKAEDEERKTKSLLEERIRLDVEKDLKPPPKAYAARENIYEGPE